MEIPEDRLPPGFARTVENPPATPAEARPAATVVVLRDGAAGLEALLLRRHPRSGFVPGAWVFPGGRVDRADAETASHERVLGLARDAHPAPPFWTAALRELFEETGVLLARDENGAWSADARSDSTLESHRMALMDGAASLHDVLESGRLTLDVGPMVHIAHWVTPVVEPRRYDTHFFAAALPEGRSARVDPREMTESLWIDPASALQRFLAGELPMVFPTVRTLESLAAYPATADALRGYRGAKVERILPRLVRTETGVTIVVDD